MACASARRHLWDPLASTVSSRRLVSDPTAGSRSPRSRSTFAAASASRLREMVYRNRRASAEPPSLPDRFANALKLFRPGILSSQSTTKPVVVDADDLVWISNVSDRNVVPSRSKANCSQNCHDFRSIDKNELPNGGHKIGRNISAQLPQALPNRNIHFESDRSHPLKTLDQIRLLYKSVPNFGVLDDEDSVDHPSHSQNMNSSRDPDQLHNTTRSADNTRTHVSVAQSSTEHSSPFGELSPRSMNATATGSATSSLSSASITSTRSAADSGYRSHKRPVYSQPKQPPPPIPSNSQPNAFTVGTNLRSLVEIKSTENLLNPISPTTVIHVSRPEDLRTSTISCWANPSTTRPERFNIPFTFNARDLRVVIEKVVPQLHLSTAIYAQILDRVRSTLELFNSELQRFVGPFGKYTIYDVNVAISSFVDQKIASDCVAFAQQALDAYGSTSSLASGIEQKTLLRLNVGKMWRYFHYNSGTKSLIFDSIAVYLSAIFEKLLVLYVQQCEQNRSTKTFAEQIRTHRTLFDGFYCFETADGCCITSIIVLDKLMDTSQFKDLDEFSWRSRWIELCKLGIRMDNGTKSALFHYVRCPKTKECLCKTRRPQFGDWMHTIMNLVVHRNSSSISASDIIEAARILLSINLPPRSTSDFVESADCVEWRVLDKPNLWRKTTDTAELRKIFANYDINSANSHGLTCLARCILMDNLPAAIALIDNGCGIDVPVVNSNIRGLRKSCRFLDDFTGWTPIFWAIVTNNAEIVQRLSKRRVALDASWMSRETPLQIAAALGNATIVKILLDHNADLLSTTTTYDKNASNDKANRRASTPSALTLSAVFGHTTVFDLLLTEFCKLVSKPDTELPPSIADLLADDTRLKNDNKFEACTQTADFAVLSSRAQISLTEALYYSVCFGNLSAAHDLTAFGVRWNVDLWRRCLEWSMEQKSGLGIKLFVDCFVTNELHNASTDAMTHFIETVFELIEQTLVHSPFLDTKIFSDVLNIVSRVFRHYYTPDPQPINSSDFSNGAKPTGLIIDSKYCDNEKFSDIRFVVEGHSIFAHRIALVNASSQFDSILQTAGDVVEVHDIDYGVFKAIIEFVYGKHSDCMHRISMQSINNQLRSINVAERYGLVELLERILNLISNQIRTENCLTIFQYASKNKNEKLLGIVQPFIVQNLSLLLCPEGAEPSLRSQFLELNRDCNVLSSLTEYLRNLVVRNPKSRSSAKKSRMMNRKKKTTKTKKKEKVPIRARRHKHQFGEVYTDIDRSLNHRHHRRRRQEQLSRHPEIEELGDAGPIVKTEPHGELEEKNRSRTAKPKHDHHRRHVHSHINAF
ncbi:BTB domain-containing protein [Aphelenchoides besseyi]|nr:BTB domain-containing protein [Aphelenchoides besseyi]